MPPVPRADQPLVDGSDVSPAEGERRRALRRFALSGIIQFHRARKGWSVEAAAAEVGIGHMTLRRVEDGTAVRTRTYSNVEELLSLKPGTLQRALGDDAVLVEVARQVGLDTQNVDLHLITAARWVEQFANSTVASSSRLSGAPPATLAGEGRLGSPLVDHAGGHDYVGPPLGRLVGEVLTRLASQQDRSKNADAAIKALLDLMPELDHDQRSRDAR